MLARNEAYGVDTLPKGTNINKPATSFYFNSRDHDAEPDPFPLILSFIGLFFA